MTDADLHGYTAEELDLLARRAARACRSLYLPFMDRMEYAWSAMAEHVCGSSTRPEPGELIRIGVNAADNEAGRTLYKEHGWRPDVGRARGFQRYWTTMSRSPSSPVEERVVENVALTQIWPRLTPAMQAALVALATHGDLAAAAESVGYRPGAYRNMLYRARLRFLRLWLEPETPTGKWGQDSRRRGGERDYFVTTMTIRRRRRRAAMEDSVREARALELRARRAALKAQTGPDT